jgi:hypothetical protein
MRLRDLKEACTGGKEKKEPQSPPYVQDFAADDEEERENYAHDGDYPHREPYELVSGVCERVA